MNWTPFWTLEIPRCLDSRAHFLVREESWGIEDTDWEAMVIKMTIKNMEVNAKSGETNAGAF